jgi:hypothetical protein
MLDLRDEIRRGFEGVIREQDSQFVLHFVFYCLFSLGGVILVVAHILGRF